MSLPKSENPKQQRRKPLLLEDYLKPEIGVVNSITEGEMEIEWKNSIGNYVNAVSNADTKPKY